MNPYLQSAIYTSLIFLLGILIGIWVDTYRLGLVQESTSLIDISSTDARLLNNLIEEFGTEHCNYALEQNLAFNDRIYREGLEIENKIEANIFTPQIEQEWRQYTLLQLQFLLNSETLKEKCGFDYQNVVHFFRLQDRLSDDVNDKVQSAVLLELKEVCGNKIMLIPITVDVDLVSVAALVGRNQITEFPAVIVDEDRVFQGVTSLPELREVVGC